MRARYTTHEQVEISTGRKQTTNTGKELNQGLPGTNPREGQYGT